MSNVRGFTAFGDEDFADFAKWRGEDIAIFDKLSDFENLKTDHNYTVTETVSDGLSTITTVIKNAGGTEIARKMVKEESATAVLTTVTIGTGTARYRVTETADGYKREAVL